METANKILRIGQVMEVTGLKRATVYLHMKQGTFPRQIKLGPKAAGWLASDIQSWITRRIAATNGR